MFIRWTAFMFALFLATACVSSGGSDKKTETIAKPQPKQAAKKPVKKYRKLYPKNDGSLKSDPMEKPQKGFDFDPTYGNDLMDEIVDSLDQDKADTQEMDDFELIEREELTEAKKQIDKKALKEAEADTSLDVEAELEQLRAAKEQQMLADEQKKAQREAIRRQENREIQRDNERSMKVYTDEFEEDEAKILPTFTEEDLSWDGLF